MRLRGRIRYLEVKIASIYIFMKDLRVGEEIGRGRKGKLGVEDYFWKSWRVCQDYIHSTWENYCCWVDYFGSEKFYFLERSITQ